jgi:O-antigen ligase
MLSIAMLICFLTLSLTDSRAGVVGTSLALGFELFLVSNVKLFHRRSKLIRILLSAFVALIGIFIVYQGADLVRNGYNRYVTVAAAEYAVVSGEGESIDSSSESIRNGDTAQGDANDLAGVKSDIKSVSSRDLSDIGTFNGRTAIWLGVLKGLAENPRFLAIGTGSLVAGETMAPYFPENSPIGNFHNSFLDVLVSFGIPGLALALVFLILVVIASVRLSFTDLTNPDTLGIRVVPAILLFTVSESMLETFLFVGGSLNIVWVWFMFASGFVFRMLKNDSVQSKITIGG